MVYTVRAPDKKPLDWNTRMKIALGIARGLKYLHHKVKPPVIYRDLKLANILLGEGFHPKLSDFGIAVFGDKTHVSTSLIDKFGYYPPEYAEFGELNIKYDVFSFGVVMFQLISRRKALDYRSSKTWILNWVSVTI